MQDPPLWFNFGVYVPGDRYGYSGGEAIMIAGCQLAWTDNTGWDRELMLMPDLKGARPIAIDSDIVPSGGAGRHLGVGIVCGLALEERIVSEGTKKVEMTVILTPLWPGSNPASHGDHDRQQNGSVSPTWKKMDLSCSFVMTPSPTLNTDDSLEADVERSISVENVQTLTGSNSRGPEGEMIGIVKCVNPPIDIAYQVSFRTPGTNRLFPDKRFFYVAKGGEAQMTISSGRWDRFRYTGKTVDVDFHADAAAAPAGAKEVWGRSLIIEGADVNGGKR
ncbi:MAG TPA: hypothetical protein VFC46_03590 [Humisphaera sp.]|nr:hypothetical protein [Humisphaera sp.]